MNEAAAKLGRNFKSFARGKKKDQDAPAPASEAPSPSFG